MPAAVDQFKVNDAVRQNSCVVINVFEKKVQGGDALGEAVLNFAPFVMRNDPRQQVIGENALCPLVVAVDSKGDSLVQKREVGGLLTLPELLGGKPQQVLEQALVVRPRRTRGREHFIVSAAKLVVTKRRTKQGQGCFWRVNPVHKSAT